MCQAKSIHETERTEQIKKNEYLLPNDKQVKIQKKKKRRTRQNSVYKGIFKEYQKSVLIYVLKPQDLNTFVQCLVQKHAFIQKEIILLQ